MADAVVAVVLEKIAKVLIEEASILTRLRDQFDSIQREMLGMKLFLKDEEAKQIRDESVKNWVREIRDVAYETEDLIDTYVLKTTRQRSTGPISFTKRYAFFFNKLIAQHKFGKEIQGIKLKIHDIYQRMPTCGLRSIDERQETRRAYSKQTSPLLSEMVVGLEKDTEKLVEELLDEHPQRRRFISIVGMGGLGKTTLAQKTYNNSCVKRCFDCRAWVCVSKNREIHEILRDIAKDVMGITKNLNNMTKRDLEEELHGLMKEKKYLVVLDDVWTTRDWDAIKPSLPDGMNGSRVLLTTRVEDVALYADPMGSRHMLPLLSKDESWELLFKKVFPNENDVTNCPPELEAVGKEIAERCGGLRLAIVVMGGLLSTKEKSESEWLKVSHTIPKQLSQAQGEEQCMELLALSYHDLPHNLKSCFLYFGLLPRNYKIPVKELMHFWVAEGLIQAVGNETLEVAAEDHLNELIKRNMIQAERKFDGSVKTCYIHDLMRDLAVSKAKEESFFNIDSPTSSRRLAVHGSINKYISLNHSIPHSTPTPHLRTLLCFPKYPEFVDRKLSRYILTKFKLLRVLNLAYVNAAFPLTGLHKFIHLRYLELRSVEMFFPQKVSPRWHFPPKIQILDISSLKGITIPNFIWTMKELRHLYVDSQAQIEPPKRTDDISLQNLQTLKTIGGDCWRLDFLVRMNGLTKLAIEGEPLKKDETEQELSVLSLSWDAENTKSPSSIDISHLTMMLSCCRKLRKLKLIGALEKQPDESHDLQPQFVKLPDSREFPQQLVKLYLFDNYLAEDPMTTLQMLPNLQNLYLHNSYEGEKMVCSAGGFRRLLYLTITCHWKLMEWIVEDGAMPSLKYLEISGCLALKMLPDGLRGLTNLAQLIVHMFSSFNDRLVKEEGSDWDKIKYIPSITTRTWI